MKSTIVLFKANGSWMATTKGPKALEQIELFGTNTLPTAFTDRASWLTVRKEIEALNPGCVIQIQF